MSEIIREIKISDVKETFKKWLDLKDDRIIEVLCATVVANWFPGDPVWLLLVGPPSSMKTEALRTLCRKDDCVEFIYSLSELTPHTLISGKSKDSSCDILPLLNKKTLVIKDLSSILTIRDDERAQIFSQLRECYDGYYERAFGSGVLKKGYYSTFGFLAGITPEIDRYRTFALALGERFLKYRIEIDRDAVKKSRQNTGREKEMRDELSSVIIDFLYQLQGKHKETFSDVTKVEVPNEIAEQLEFLADMSALLRTPVIRDRNHVVQILPEPEIGTRLVKTFWKLIIALALVNDRTKVNEEDLKIIRKIAQDAIPRREWNLICTIIKELNNCLGKSTRELGIAANIPTNTCRELLEDLALLGVLERKESTKTDRDEDTWFLKDIYKKKLCDFTNTILHAKSCKGDTGGYDISLPDSACKVVFDEEAKNELESWLINHFKNYPGIPKTFFVNDALKMFPSADPEKIQNFYEFLIDAKKLSKFVQERKKIREEDTYRDLKFAPDYNKKLLDFLISQNEIKTEKYPPPYKGEWYVWVLE